MPLQSMTGFARGGFSTGAASWVWEVKSVNGRGLEARCRLAPGFDALDLRVKALAQELFKRGNLQVSLQLAREQKNAQVRVNREALAQILDAMSDIGEDIAADPPSLDGLFALKGVIETVEAPETEEEHAALEEEMLRSLRAVLEQLAEARAEEGARLHVLLTRDIDSIATLTQAAKAHAAAQPDVLKAKMHESIAALRDVVPALSEERLAQELALLAVKGDIREELDRLTAHVAQARALFEGREPAGRRLDFLAQEFMREANTLCSKASDVSLTQVGLELKAVIDQFREQVQNVE